MSDGWLLLLFVTSAPQTFSTVQQAIRGELPPREQVHKAAALAAVYTLGVGVALTAITRNLTPLYATVPIILANLAAHEYAYAIAPVQRVSSERDAALG